MKFENGQYVSYTALSGRSYTGTVIERKMNLKRGLIIKCTTKHIDFHYLIEIKKNGVTDKILCEEKDLSILHVDSGAQKQVA